MKTIALIALLCGADAITLRRTSGETENSEANHPSNVWQGEYLLNNGRRPIQFAPHGGIVPIRQTLDTYPQKEHQLYKPLISENQRDEDDILNFYNPDLADSFHHKDYLQTDATLRRTSAETENSEKNHPSNVWQGEYLLNNGRRPIQMAPHGGIVPIRQTSDTYPQKEHQLYKPLITENQRDEDDIKNFYNSDLSSSFHHRDYVQTGASEWPLLDNGGRPQQLAPHGGIVPIRRSSDTHPQMNKQLYQPVSMENQVDADDYKNTYNPNIQPSYQTY